MAQAHIPGIAELIYNLVPGLELPVTALPPADPPGLVAGPWPRQQDPSALGPAIAAQMNVNRMNHPHQFSRHWDPPPPPVGSAFSSPLNPSGIRLKMMTDPAAARPPISTYSPAPPMPLQSTHSMIDTGDDFLSHQKHISYKRSRPTEDTKCSNCGTKSTPFWRRDRLSGLELCNACGLYAMKNELPRPHSLARSHQMLRDPYKNQLNSGQDGNGGIYSCENDAGAQPIESMLPPRVVQGVVPTTAAAPGSADSGRDGGAGEFIEGDATIEVNRSNDPGVQDSRGDQTGTDVHQTGTDVHPSGAQTMQNAHITTFQPQSALYKPDARSGGTSQELPGSNEPIAEQCALPAADSEQNAPLVSFNTPKMVAAALEAVAKANLQPHPVSGN